MSKIENENPLGLKWTWYLFLLANILVVLGIAIAWIWRHNNLGASDNGVYSIVIVCNIVAIVAVGIFYYLDLKDMVLIKQHLKKSTLTIYFAAGFIFIAAIIFSFIYNMFVFKIAANLNDGHAPTNETWNTTYIIDFAASCGITLLAVGLYRYAKYRIDLTIFRRRRGEDTSTSTEASKDVPPASSNLVDHAGK